MFMGMHIYIYIDIYFFIYVYIYMGARAPLLFTRRYMALLLYLRVMP
jgi:hypothetical protein